MKLIKVIQILLSILFIASIVTALSSEKIYFLDLEYDKGTLKLADINVITGYPILSKDVSLPYKLELLSVDKEILYKGSFEIPNKIYAPPPLDPEERSGIIELDHLNFSISFPYHKEGNLIKIIKDEKVLLIIDVSRFSMYCGDSICQSDENQQNCLQDCLSFKKPKFEAIKEFNWLYIIIPLAILVIMGLILYLIKRKEY